MCWWLWNETYINSTVTVLGPFCCLSFFKDKVFTNNGENSQSNRGLKVLVCTRSCQNPGIYQWSTAPTVSAGKRRNLKETLLQAQATLRHTNSKGQVWDECGGFALNTSQTTWKKATVAHRRKLIVDKKKLLDVQRQPLEHSGTHGWDGKGKILDGDKCGTWRQVWLELY